jgi:small subunit ribosomal protein S9
MADTATKSTERYYEGIGRRKTSVARVKLFTKGDRSMVVNGKSVEEYFSTPAQQISAQSALEKMNVEEKFRVEVKVTGGGKSAQADAIRLGSARAMLEFNQEFRKRLKKAGYLTRDARKVERKKPGLKKARRKPQWSKR